jgi:hypothetical protein
MLNEWAKIKDKLFRALHLIMDNLFRKKLVDERQKKSFFKTSNCAKKVTFENDKP